LHSSNNGHSATEGKKEIDFQTVITQLKENLEDIDEFPMPIRRGHVLEDALRNMGRSSFSPKLPLHVFNIHKCAFIISSVVSHRYNFWGRKLKMVGVQNENFGH